MLDVSTGRMPTSKMSAFMIMLKRINLNSLVCGTNGSVAIEPWGISFAYTMRK
jgi:hypothetical protein